MKALLALWALPLTQRRNQGVMSLLIVSGMLLLLSAGLAALFLLAAKPQYLSFPFGASSAVLVLLWWSMYIESVAGLCSPVNLQLTPQLKRRIVLASSLMWLALSLLLVSFFNNPPIFCVVVLAVAASLAVKSRRVKVAVFAAAALWIIYSTLATLFLGLSVSASGYFPRLGFGFNAIWALAASLLGLVALPRLLPMLSVFLWMAMVVFIFANRNNAELSPRFFLDTVEFLFSQPAMLMAFALGLGGLTLLGLIGQSGDAKIARYQRTVAFREALKSANNPAQAAKWHTQPLLLFGYVRSLMYSLRRAPQRLVPAHRLLGFGFGPTLHWSYLAWVSVVWGGFVSFLPWALSWTDARGFATSTAFIFPAMVVILAPQLVRTLYQTRREQAMLSLTPQWPSAKVLNRWLAWFVCRYVLAIWLVCIAVLLSASVVYHLAPDALTGPILGATLCALIVCGGVMRDFAHREKPGNFTGVLTAFFALLPYAAVMLTMLLKGPFILVALLIALPTSAFVVWRWRRLVNGPRALPCGWVA